MAALRRRLHSTMEKPQCYDLVVIGSGPAGQKAAICAAKLRKNVAIVERTRTIGGVCVHTGTIPSKTFREAVLYLSGFRQRTFYGRSYTLKDKISMQDLNFRAQSVMAREIEVIKSQLHRNGITVVEGEGKLLDAHTIEVSREDGSTLLRAENILIACGTRPAHDASIPIDVKRIFDSRPDPCPGRDSPRPAGGGRRSNRTGVHLDACGAGSEGDADRPAADTLGFRGSRGD